MEPSTADFEAWYRREHDRLARTLVVASGDVDVAADIAAEAFSRAWERWDRVGVMVSPGGWAYRVAVNLLRRRWRRERLERRLLRRDHHIVDDTPSVDVDLWEAVARLPARQREAVALRYVADLKESEVASAMGVSEGAASATLAAARRRLAEILAPEPVEMGVER